MLLRYVLACISCFASMRHETNAHRQQTCANWLEEFRDFGGFRKSANAHVWQVIFE